MRVLLLGAPGSGKGTQGDRIADRYRTPHVSTGDLLRANVGQGTELGRIAQPYMERGELVPDELIIDMVREHRSRLDPDVGYIMDGYPRTLEQAHEAYDVAREAGTTLDAVVFLDTSEDELLQRLSERARLQGRTDDSDDTIRRRLKVYEEQTMPLLDYYDARGILHRIDGSGSVDTVSDRIFAVLDLLK